MTDKKNTKKAEAAAAEEETKQAKKGKAKAGKDKARKAAAKKASKEAENDAKADEAKEDKAKTANKEQTDWKDKYLRLSAEFDNYRKRTLKEKADLTKFAGEEILKNFLPVIDDLERAMASLETANDIKALKQGIELISNKMAVFLTKEGLTELKCQGKEFDAELHEAITKIPAPEKKLKGKIIDVVEKGYTLKEKIIRYPKVVIGE